MKKSFRLLPCLVLCVATGPLLPGQPTNAALVRHAPAIDGVVDGSLQLLLGENVTLPGGATITGDLLVPGTPTLRLNGSTVTFGGTQVGSGSAAPSGYTITLNNQVTLGHLRTRTDPVALPAVAPPAAPSGTRRVTLNRPEETPGNFATLRDLSLVGRGGQVVVPPGVYGDFSASSGSGFTLGVQGATVPAEYSFQQLRLDSGSELRVVGPVVVTLASGTASNGPMGTAAHPEWLTLRYAAGGLGIHGKTAVYGAVVAPAGAITITGQAQLVGSVASDQLTVLAGGSLRLVTLAPNQPPAVFLTSPANGDTFFAPATIQLAATATDADGTVAKVEFFQDGNLVGTTATSPYQLTVSGLLAGVYAFTARATDNGGATGAANAATVTVANVNQPPSVRLTAPAGGAIFDFPATILLAAEASDPDGAIARVEFFEGTHRLGEAPVAPFNFTWTGMLPGVYRLSARAFDLQGASAATPETTITVRSGLPFAADFEAAEGYALGALDEQGGWSVSGAASVTTADHSSGARAVVLAPTAPATRIAHTFPVYPPQPVIFADLFVKLAAGADPGTSALLQAEGARVALVRNGSQGELQVFAGDGAGDGTWRTTGFKVDLDASGAAVEWLRLTVREDFSTQTWDLYANGRLVAYDLGCVDATQTRFTMFALTGTSTAATAADALLIGFDNPLFVDADRDGLDDAWELANGLNPAVNDRNGDRDGDGLSNLREFQLGLAANKADTDDDGMPDPWELQYGLDPRRNDANGDLVGDGVSNLTKYLLGRDPTKPALTDTTGLIHLKVILPR